MEKCKEFSRSALQHQLKKWKEKIYTEDPAKDGCCQVRDIGGWDVNK